MKYLKTNNISHNLIISAYLFILAILFYFSLEDFQISVELPNIYQARDIQRTLDLVFNHKWIWFGPELSGGGTLPGPFYYWLLAIPIYFQSEKFLAFYAYFLAALSAPLIWYTLKKYFSEISGYLGFLFFLNSYFAAERIKNFWNPSYLYLFQSLTLLLLLNFQNRIYLILGALVLGFSVQIHYTQLVFLFGFVFSIPFIKFFNTQKKIETLLIFLFFFLIPITPYLFWKFTSNNFVNVQDKFSSAAITFLSHLKPDAYSEIDFSKRNIMNILTIFLSEVFILSGFAILFFKKMFFLRKNMFLKISFLISALMLPLLLAGFFLSRYLTPFFWLYTILLAIYLPEVFEKSKKNLLIFVAAASFLIAIKIFFFFNYFQPTEVFLSFSAFGILALIFAFLFIKKKSERNLFILFLVITMFNAHLIKFRSDNALSRPDFTGAVEKEVLNKLITTIIKETGWSYDYFREHTFLRGLDREIDLSLLYIATQKKQRKVSATNHDGLIIIGNNIGNLFNIDTNKINLIEARNILPDILFRALSENSISCTQLLLIDKFQLCFYKHNDLIKHRWNNIGYAYRHQYKNDLHVASESGLFVKAHNEAIFYINQCSNREAACTIFFNVKIAENKLYLEASGDPLASIDPAVNPAWVVSFVRPTLRVQCGPQQSVFIITEKLGYDSQRFSLLAPFTADFKLTCKKPDLIAVSLNEGLSIFNNYKTRRLSEIELVWNIK